MNTILYFSTQGLVYETRAYTRADIDRLVHDRALQSLSSADRQFDFWFSSTAGRCQRRVNRHATELLMATSSFTAKTVPLLRGAVVVATHDADGDLDGLSWQQLDVLAQRIRSISDRDERQLTRRIVRDQRRRRRSAVPVTAASQPFGVPPRIAAAS
ncbi:hypothetical protein FK535_01945 [Mycolicibacterium sp. 018/SC-01/001]|uniref:hypothetical protein n=1 Tax=Mycolicibacterium sp. 018/SC-01/001 TaxID=2592069 RepID=UPI00117D1A6A|nr:hypothetical protein [Mycolicibacterium sp. 018/SC-01/001]TRW89049.1 hypothetical protein FK535_01945 [Mycolicibacterium sp. 018/SC-01/001]